MGHGCPKSLRCREGTDHNCAVSDSDTSPACGPKLVAGRAVQGEVVESEDTVLENSLTYKKMCVCGCVWPGWKRGRWEGGDKEWKGTRISCHHIIVSSPSLWEEEGPRWAHLSHTKPISYRRRVEQL